MIVGESFFRNEFVPKTHLIIFTKTVNFFRLKNLSLQYITWSKCQFKQAIYKLLQFKDLQRKITDKYLFLFLSLYITYTCVKSTLGHVMNTLIEKK